MNCPNLQKSLGWCDGKPVFPGVRRRLYYLSKNQILKWPRLPRDGSGRYTSSDYVGSFTLFADVTWKHIDVLISSSGLTSEPQGEYPSQEQLNKLVVVHPGVGTEASAAAAYLNNNDNVFLIQDMEGDWRVVGSDLYPVKTTVNQDLGQGPTGTASTTINVEAIDVMPAPFYNGIIRTEGGDIVADEAAYVDEAVSSLRFERETGRIILTIN